MHLGPLDPTTPGAGRRVVILFALLLLVMFVARAERSADDWFLLTIDIERSIDKLDRDDQRFVRQMINRLTVDHTATPTTAQQQWLLDIRRRLDNGK